jgi:hypothetical protein
MLRIGVVEAKPAEKPSRTGGHLLAQFSEVRAFSLRMFPIKSDPGGIAIHG